MARLTLVIAILAASEGSAQEACIEPVRPGAGYLADAGYDADWIRAELADLRVQAVIPSSKSRSQAIEHDRDLYKHRHVVECFFNKIKWFRRVFTRYDKLDVAYLAWLTMASCLVWMR